MALNTLIDCLVATNNSCGSSSSSKFFVFNLNIAPFSFFAADSNLFNCVFVSLTLSLFLINYHLL